jgi:hypothetical protein
MATGRAPAQFRDALTDLRWLFEDVIADGGKDTAWFLQEDRKRVAVLVRNQAERAEAGKLKRSALAAVTSWDAACAGAPAEAEPVVLIGDHSDGQHRQFALEHDQRQSQATDVAEEGVGHCLAAITRLNALER